jgi:hypothetical protein
MEEVWLSLYLLRARFVLERAFLDSIQSSEGVQISLDPLHLTALKADGETRREEGKWLGIHAKRF